MSAELNFQFIDRELLRIDSSIVTQGALGVAVSGGPDSMALAHVVIGWAQKRPDPPTLHILCVDHGLRPESRKEAETAACHISSWPQSRGRVQTQILNWEHTDLKSRIQEQARTARYALMAKYCQKHDIRYLFLGHHQDDQAETFLFRLAKGSGLDGLSAMREIQDYNSDLKVVRPFLGISKSKILNYCEVQKIEFVEDPSNDSERFARVRLRKFLPALEAEGLSNQRLAQTAKRIARAREALEILSNNLYNLSVLEKNTKQIVLNLNELRSQPLELVIRCVLITMNDMVPFLDYPPRLEKIEDLCIDILKNEAFRKRTIAGIIIERNDQKNHLILKREHE